MAHIVVMSMAANSLRLRGTIEYKAAHYRGFWERAKKRLADERSRHAEALRRLACFHRQQLTDLAQSLAKEFESRFNSKARELECHYRKKIEGYEERIAELESELSLFRDHVQGRGHKEDLDFSEDPCQEAQGPWKRWQKARNAGRSFTS